MILYGTFFLFFATKTTSLALPPRKQRARKLPSTCNENLLSNGALTNESQQLILV